MSKRFYKREEFTLHVRDEDGKLHHIGGQTLEISINSEKLQSIAPKDYEKDVYQLMEQEWTEMFEEIEDEYADTNELGFIMKRKKT